MKQSRLECAQVAKGGSWPDRRESFSFRRGEVDRADGRGHRGSAVCEEEYTYHVITGSAGLAEGWRWAGMYKPSSVQMRNLSVEEHVYVFRRRVRTVGQTRVGITTWILPSPDFEGVKLVRAFIVKPSELHNQQGCNGRPSRPVGGCFAAESRLKNKAKLSEAVFRVHKRRELQQVDLRETFRPRVLGEAICHTISPVTRIHTDISSFPFFPSILSPMSTSPAIPRPPSRSERLLRDALRRDDTLRTYGPSSSRPRSNSSSCDDDEEDNIFQSAILLRCSSRRDSAASALGHGPSTGYYVPGDEEHASYSRLLRSPSHSGSSRSGRSDRRSSPPRTAYMQEKQEDLSRHHDAAPHEAVLRSRLDSVIHSMQIDRHGDVDVSPRFTESGSYSSLYNRR